MLERLERRVLFVSAFIMISPSIIFTVNGENPKSVDEVVTNITRINNLLKEILRNYVHLENIERALSDYTDINSLEYYTEKSSTRPRDNPTQILEYSFEMTTPRAYQMTTPRAYQMTTPRAYKMANSRITETYDSSESVDETTNAKKTKDESEILTNYDDKIVKRFSDKDFEFVDDTKILRLGNGPGNEMEMSFELYFSDHGMCDGGTGLKRRRYSQNSDMNGKKYWFDIYPKRTSRKRKIYDTVKESTNIKWGAKKADFSSEKLESSLENEKTLSILAHRGSILREADKEACVKVVVRKCFLASCQASVKMCNTHSCPKGFHDAFKSCSKSACIAAFPEGTSPAQPYSRAKFRDLTRNGFLSVLCLPRTTENQHRFSLINNKPQRRKDSELMRYETQCLQAALDRCGKACDKSFRSACSSRACDTRLMRDFPMSCFEGCKRYFVGPPAINNDNYFDTSKSKDSTDTDTDTDTDSD